MKKEFFTYSTEETADKATDKLRLCKCPPDFFPVNKLYRRPMLEALGLRFAENVQYLCTNKYFLLAIKNTVIFTGIAAPSTVCISFVMAILTLKAASNWIPKRCLS